MFWVSQLKVPEIQEALKIYEQMEKWRRKFHENPELSFQEYETSDFIYKTLNEFA